MPPRRHLLFVCSRNQWRSPTGEAVFRDDPRFAVRSRGTSQRARRTLRADDLVWADLVFVMENTHRAKVLAEHRDALGDTPLCVLHIPDDYRAMDPELIDLIRDGVERHVGPAETSDDSNA